MSTVLLDAVGGSATHDELDALIERIDDDFPPLHEVAKSEHSFRLAQSATVP